jgi:hypothetical protein
MASGPVRQPYAGVDFIPQSGIYEFGYRREVTVFAGREIEDIPTRGLHISPSLDLLFLQLHIQSKIFTSVFRIRDMLVQIRGSVLLTNGSGSFRQ